MMSSRRLLLVILIVAAMVRIYGVDFGMPFVNARPDETQIAGPAVGFLTGNLRPPLLEWPTLMPYTVALCYLLYYTVTRPFAGYRTLADFAESRRADISPFIYIPRSLSIVMGIVTVWAVYALAKRMCDRTIALVAAVFLALSFLHVRDSHFGVTDIPMTALVVVSVLAIDRWRRGGGTGRAALAGMVAGLATSTKYNAAVVVASFGVAVGKGFVEERPQGNAASRAMAALAIFAGTFVAALLATSPYIVIDWPRFVRSVSATQSMITQGHGIVLSRGWWYYGRVVLPAALGWPLFVVGLAGALSLLVARFRDAGAVFAFPVVYYLIAGRGYGVFARYILPMLPFLCIGAAWTVVEAARALTRRGGEGVRRAAIAAMTIAIVAPSAYKIVLLDRLLSRTDNRTITGRALMDILEPGSLLYQSGEPYGYAALVENGRGANVRLATFNPETARFFPDDPDWILIQRSGLVVYSNVPPALESRLRADYTLVRSFPTAVTERSDRVYDQQDAFYIPLSGLEGLERPGPGFELYRRIR